MVMIEAAAIEARSRQEIKMSESSSSTGLYTKYCTFVLVTVLVPSIRRLDKIGGSRSSRINIETANRANTCLGV